MLARIAAPIATELPEAIPSVLGIRRGHDTLAFGNITGALAFQGGLLPALGMTLTPWRPTPLVLAALLIAIAGAVMRRVCIMRAIVLRPTPMRAGGLLYAGFLGYRLAA